MRHSLRGTQVKANIMLVDYRGYGMSDGSPSQAGLLLDAQVRLCLCCGTSHTTYSIHTHTYRSALTIASFPPQRVQR